ncbi:YycH family regulatory protein [Bombilactobacillus thymidiniphilus]|uniref:Two-component system activity regulator YycH n=1 Tax=Bombilactobacillus thymidiniphilus TaxID=2923363 RepID=A0ABY4PFK9_9LACO|nr:two-component system activity regulator YycH [Bombilactobacillus thymidiniphilus]UQS84294.1 two-component system activity regulator YycH [Bombilactobacillus thymidiniphilus]
MKSFSNAVLRGTLLIAVVISVILSWMIWSNNAKYQQGVQSNNNLQTLHQRTTSVPRNMDDVFSPTRLILTRQSEKQYIMYNNQSNTIDNVVKEIKKAHITGIKQISTKNKNRYQNFLHLQSSVQLSYPTKISINSFAEMMNQKDLSVHNDKLINRIIILRNKNLQHQIYFLDDQNFTIYQAQITDLNSKKMHNLLKDNNFSVPVNVQTNSHGVQVYYLQPMKIKRISYLVADQNNNTLIANLLNSNQGVNITTRKEDNLTTYRSGVNRSMIVDNKTSLVTLNDYTKTKMPQTTMDLFSNSYRTLTQIGTSLSGLYLFNYNQRERQLSFRNYVDGFPIFQQDQIGTVKINYSNDGQTAVFSKKFFQVPIPTDQQPVELPSTQTLITRLENAGYNMKDLQNIVIGYSWSNNDQNKNIIDLTPTYYIFYNNQWHTYDELLSQGR